VIRSSVFLAQPDAGFSPLSFRRLIGTASPGPGAHPRTRVFDSVCVRDLLRHGLHSFAASQPQARPAKQETSPAQILISLGTILWRPTPPPSAERQRHPV
jgi:hypothetical protein